MSRFWDTRLSRWEIHRKTPEWPYTYKCQKCPLCTKYVVPTLVPTLLPPRPKFGSLTYISRVLIFISQFFNSLLSFNIYFPFVIFYSRFFKFISMFWISVSGVHFIIFTRFLIFISDTGFNTYLSVLIIVLSMFLIFISRCKMGRKIMYASVPT